MTFHDFLALSLGFSLGTIFFTFLFWACSPFSDRGR